MAIAAAIAALLVLGMTMLIVRRVTKPLRAVTELLTVLAEGRTDVEVAHANRHDEIGAIARTVDVFKKIASSAANSRPNASAPRSWQWTGAKRN